MSPPPTQTFTHREREREGKGKRESGGRHRHISPLSPSDRHSPCPPTRKIRSGLGREGANEQQLGRVDDIAQMALCPQANNTVTPSSIRRAGHLKNKQRDKGCFVHFKCRYLLITQCGFMQANNRARPGLPRRPKLGAKKIAIEWGSTVVRCHK